jgi:hypothetical protein
MNDKLTIVEDSEAELPENITIKILERALGTIGTASYDTGYLTALKTSKGLIQSMDKPAALQALNSMIDIFINPDVPEDEEIRHDDV